MASKTKAAPTGVSVGRMADTPVRPSELDRLEVFIGRWMTEGEIAGGAGGESTRIVASDVYQWLPGRHFVMHPAYGRIGTAGVGGLEVIGYDAATGQFVTYFFDSQGNMSSQALLYRDGTWLWQGRKARCTGTFEDGGKALMARHERSDDGLKWVPSMEVTLRKID
jgi:hypothetical protein